VVVVGASVMAESRRGLVESRSTTKQAGNDSTSICNDTS